MNAADLKEKADALARRTEDRLRTLQWMDIIETPLDSKALSDGALVMVGALLSLTIPHLKDLLQVMPLVSMKTVLGMLLLSGALGILSRGIYASVKMQIGREKSELRDAFIAVYSDHKKEFDKLHEEAKTAGLEVADSVDWGKRFDLLAKHSPMMMKWVVKEWAARNKDPEKRWRDAKKAADWYSSLVFLQLCFMVGAIAATLVALKEPNSESCVTQQPSHDSG